MKHIVGFSGGIDSQACARWVLNRYPPEDVILLNSNAGGNEHPLTVAFVLEYSREVFPVTIVRPVTADIWETEAPLERHGLTGSEPLTFPGLAKIKGRFPSRTAQFCTNFLKIEPSRRWVEENLGGGGYIRYAGVRRDESESRKSTPFQGWDATFDCDVVHPIADWTKQMCFDYVRAHKEPINPLYSLGFERVGCAPCVNSGKDDIRRWADRFPEMIDKVRRWEAARLEQLSSRLAFPGNTSTGSTRLSSGVARTARGGRQFNILKAEGLERPACESKFGLCE